MPRFFRVEIDGFAYNGSETPVLSGVRLDIQEGELVGVMGPNGCGKSTLLQLIAGDLPLRNGRVTGSVETGEISFIYQDYRRSLFPWKSAYENIRLPLRIAGKNGRTKELIDDLKQEFALGYNLGKLPRFLSGGEQQKICMLRALMESPKLLLMDECCSAMDYSSRLHFLTTLKKRLKQDRVSALFVSHSAEETLLFADRVILLSGSGAIVSEMTDCQLQEKFADHINTIHAHFLG